MTTAIPIKDAQDIAEKHGYDQIVILARKTGDNGMEHVTTYGVNKYHCEIARKMGLVLKHDIMGWPQVLIDSDQMQSMLTINSTLSQEIPFLNSNNEYVGGEIDSEKSTNEIKTVSKVSKDAGDYIVNCPHCKRILSIEGEDLSEIKGEQYQDRVCGGWFKVSHNATFVREL